MHAVQSRAARALLTPVLSIVVVGIGLMALSASKRGPRLIGELAGRVVIAGRPVIGAAVSLNMATAGKPTALAHATTGSDGNFTLEITEPRPDPKGDLYVLVEGGRATADGDRDPNGGLTLLAVLGATLPKRVTVNELTTVASAFTNAQFIHGSEIRGNALSLRIAAGNVPNFVDVETGGWGEVLLDPINSTQTTTLATLNTLASLITAYATTHDEGWRARFFEITTANGARPTSTLEAMANIARAPWVHAKTLYALFDQAYPQPADGARRKAPFAPYLALTPPDFALMLAFAGGGMYANGRLMFDADGNLWSGQNWMPGSQSGVLRAIGGGTIKLAPNGKPLSPPIDGFTGIGVDGIGWGTGVTRDKVFQCEPATAACTFLADYTGSGLTSLSFVPANIAQPDGPEAIRGRVTETIMSRHEDLASQLTPLLSLLDIPVDDPTWNDVDPAQRRQRIQDAVKRLLLHESRIQPLLLIVEDLHWIDGETQTLLDDELLPHAARIDGPTATAPASKPARPRNCRRSRRACASSSMDVGR